MKLRLGLKKCLIILLSIFLVVLLYLIVMLHNHTGFIKKFPFITNSWVYIGDDGKVLKGLQEIEEDLYYFDEESGKMATGIQEVGKTTYYFDKKGKAQKGFHSDCFFDENKEMVRKQWEVYHVNDQKRISYFGADGKIKKGKFKVSGKEFTADKNGNVQPDFDTLQKGIEEIIAKYSGEVSVYYKDLKTDSTLVLNNQVMYPCCMIKVPGLVEVYRQSLNTPENAFNIEKMITISDNTCFNIMANKAGPENINQLCKDAGMEQTELHHALRPGGYLFGDGGQNCSSALDVGNLLDQIYHGTIASKEQCQGIIDVMSRCLDSSKLRRGIPYDVVFAHKSGDATVFHHDGGIVFLPGSEYILVVFTQSAGNFELLMGEISSYVFNFQQENMLPLTQGI